METQALELAGGTDAALAENRLGLLQKFMDVSEVFLKSGYCPKGITTKEQVAVTLLHGYSIGLSETQALQSIATINGRPSVYGDTALALIRSKNLLEDYRVEYGYYGKSGEELTDTEKPDADRYGAKVTVKRTGQPEASDFFTVADAKTADLWGKAGPWKQYPKRMIMFRARGFLLRDQFGDALKGLNVAEPEDADTEGRFNAAKPVTEADRKEAQEKQRKQADAFLSELAGDSETETVANTPDPTPIKKDAPTWLDQLCNWVSEAQLPIDSVCLFAADHFKLKSIPKTLRDIPEKHIKTLLGSSRDNFAKQISKVEVRG